MKEFEVKIILNVVEDEDYDIEMRVSKTQEMTIKDALTNFDNEYLSDRLELIEASEDYFNDEEQGKDVYNITIKSGEEIKSELEELISEDLYKYIQPRYLYENFGVEGEASVYSIEISGISLDELREEAVELSQKHHDAMDTDEQVIYRVE
jgi:hypothetical protein